LAARAEKTVFMKSHISFTILNASMKGDGSKSKEGSMTSTSLTAIYDSRKNTRE